MIGQRPAALLSVRRTASKLADRWVRTGCPSARVGLLAAALLAVSPARAGDDAVSAPKPDAPELAPSLAELPSLGPLSGAIRLGAAGPWSVAVDEGRLVVTGAADVRSTDVWSANARWGGDAVGGEVAIRVEADAQPGSLSGLMFHASDRGALIWAMRGDGAVALYRRAGADLTEVVKAEVPGGHREAGDLLGVREGPDGARLLVNGRLVTALDRAAEGDGATTQVGIVAAGPGRRTFRSFAVAPSPDLATAATPAPAPVPARAADPTPARPGGGGDRLATLGALAERIDLGSSGAWTADAVGGRLILANPAKPGAVRSYETPWQGDAHGRSVGVRVKLDGKGSGSAAGLILRRADGDPHWLAWVATADGRYALYSRDEAGLHIIDADAIPGGLRAGGDLLQVSQEGDRIAFLIDGTFVTRSPAGGKVPASDAPVGVLAMGEGTFAIGDFGFGPALAAAEASTPVPPQPTPMKAGQDDTVPDPTRAAPSGEAMPPKPAAAIPKADGPTPAPPARDARQDVPELGPLGKDVQLGSRGPWTETVEGNRYIVSNATDDDSVDDFTTAWQGSRKPGRSLSARVETSSGVGSAGLVFGYDGKTDRSILFIVSPDRKASVVALRNGKADAIATMTLDSARPAEGDLLAITQTEAGTVLRADGEVVATLSPNDGRGLDETGGVGIAAVGIGRFAFHAVAFGSTAPSSAAGSGGNPAAVKLPKFKAGGQLTHFTGETFGATIGILAHEFGHFMIGELKIPATGPEEDVADEFAAMVFVDNIRNDAQSAVLPAIGAAKFWWFEAEDHGDNATPWYDEHAPDRARFAKFMCMLYGADGRDFGSVMDAAGIPDRSKQRCLADEPKRQRAWTTLLRPYRRAGVDPIEVGDLDPATPGHKLTVEYRPSKSPALQPFAEEIRKSGVFDYLAAYISAVYVLPRDTKIVFKDCGIMNCWYQGDTGDVTMCWEMIGSVLGTFRKHEAQVTHAGDGQRGPNGGGPPPPAPQNLPASPSPPAAGQEMTLVQFMRGRWHSQIRSPQGPQEGFFDLDAQGRYTARIRSDTPNGPFVLDVEGTWSVAPQGGAHVQLVLTPSRWSPRQFCQGPGYCTPINMQAQISQIEIVDRDTLRSAVGESKRMP